MFNQIRHMTASSSRSNDPSRSPLKLLSHLSRWFKSFSSSERSSSSLSDVVHYCSQKSYPNLNLPSLEVVFTTGLIFLSFLLFFPWFSPHFQQIRLGWAVVIPSAIKASKGFKVDFTQQSTGVKVDFEGQDSFNGLSQTIKFFLEWLYGARNMLIFPVSQLM